MAERVFKQLALTFLFPGCMSELCAEETSASDPQPSRIVTGFSRRVAKGTTSRSILEENYMKKPFWAVFALSFALVMASASRSLAQDNLAMHLRHPRPGKLNLSQSAPEPGAIPPSSAYTFTFINYPGQLNTDFLAVNLGATSSQQLMVGNYNAEAPFGGFLVDFSSTDGVTSETFGTVQNYPGSTSSYPLGINNSGQIIGAYTDSAGDSHGYVLFDGDFTAINVPFQGAVNTYPECINDEDDIVGIWGAAQQQGFEEIGGVYSIIQVPGSTSTWPFGINDSDDVVGRYAANGNFYGFELSGGVYTTIQLPGAAETAAVAINNSGEIVGYYCPTSACDVYGGFLLKGGVYSKIAVPEAMSTVPYNLSDAGVIAGNYWDGKLTTALSYGFVAVPK